MYTKSFPKSLISIFEKCDLRTKTKPEELPSGDRTRKIVDMVQFHVLHPESAQLNLQHEDYVRDGRSDDFKGCSVYYKDVAEHNKKHVVLSYQRLQEIIKGAGGEYSGHRKEVRLN